MKIIKLTTVFAIAAFLTGCYQTVEPATKGKLLTTSGYQPEVISPGRVWVGFNERLVSLDTATKTYKEPVEVILSDKLTLHVDVRFSGRISGADKIINTMFNDIKAGQDNFISFDEVYIVYGQMLVRNKTREIIGQYNADDVHKNYKRISQQLASALSESLSSTPLEINNVTLGNIQYPAVITQAVEAAEERRLAIEKEEAQAAIELTKKKNERALAEADYQIEITRAKAVRDKNKIIGEGITPELIKLKQLEVQQAMAENKSAVFMPYESLNNVGAQTRMFKSN